MSWLEERLMLRPFEEEAIKPEIERIAMAHNIASKFTSFVCVDHSVRSHGERRHVVQPTELPAQWDPAFGGGAAGMPLFAPIPAPMMRPASAAFSAPAPTRSRMMGAESTGEYPQVSYPGSAPSQVPSGEASSNGFSFREALEQLVPSFLTRSSAKKSSGTERVKAEHSADFAGELARTQNANGSYGDDIRRSAAALLALLLLGFTRKKGDRRRTVRKLAEWLGQYDENADAAFALNALQIAEKSGVSIDFDRWSVLTNAGSEGVVLATLLGTSR